MKYISIAVLVVFINACAIGQKSNCSVVVDEYGRHQSYFNNVKFINLQKDRTRITILYDVQGRFTGNLNRITQQLIEKLTNNSDSEESLPTDTRSFGMKIDAFSIRAIKDYYEGHVSLSYTVDGVEQKKISVSKEYQGDPVIVQENIILDLKDEFIKTSSLCGPY